MGSTFLAFALAVASSAGAPPAPGPHPTLSVARLSDFTVPAASPRAGDERLERVIARAQRDFARSQKEAGLAGSTPLFGAEGLPKPALPRR